MSRFLIFTFIVLANVAGVTLALVPSLVTFAQILPAGIDCSSCGSAEVKSALIQAASLGRAQVISTINFTSVGVILAALFNVAVVGAILFIPALTRRSTVAAASGSPLP